MSTIITLIEISFMFMIYNLIFNGSILKNINKIIRTIFLVAICYIILTRVLIVNNIVSLGICLLVSGVTVSKIDKKEIIDSLAEIGISAIGVFAIELIASLGIVLITGNIDVEFVVLLIILILLMSICLWIINKFISKKEIDFKGKVSKFRNINLIIVNILIFFLFVKVLSTLDLFYSEVVIQVSILCVILIVINTLYIINLSSRKLVEKKIEINSNLNPLINELMTSMKASEHEYKNHLNMLYSMIQVCKTEELKDKAKAYVGEITTKNDILSKVSGIENTIIKAILFSKLQEAEKFKIDLTYEIESDLKLIALDDSELTVLLSNLINNAIEATKSINNKEIDLYIGEINDQYVIEISNSIEESINIDKKSLFKQGYSTKDSNRGYGLWNVKAIVDKYKGKIELDLCDNRVLFIIKI